MGRSVPLVCGRTMREHGTHRDPTKEFFLAAFLCDFAPSGQLSCVMLLKVAHHSYQNAPDDKF